MDSSERIYRELISEDASIWYIADDYGSKIMLKLPTTAIKSILKGCKVQFLFGKDNNYFHIGIRIYDDEEHYLAVSGINRFEEEHFAVKKIIANSSTPVEFYNELDVCFARSNVSFKEKDKQNIIEMLGDITKLYIGDLDENASTSLDSFEYSMNKERKFKKAYKIETYVSEGQFSKFSIMTTHFLGLKDNFKIEINELNEGELLEKMAWASLESLFDENLYKNPQIIRKNKKRELMDILAFYEKGYFLIESKALAITSLNKEKDMDKKIFGIQKQIIKSIRQLVGASKVLQTNQTIFDSKDNEIIFNKGIVPHCIVLVSDIFPLGNWRELEELILNTIKHEKFFLNVMELTDFLKHIKLCSGKKEIFDYNLMKRTELFSSNKTIHIKTRLKNAI